ncbi:cysteine hydrolase [Sphingomonas sp. MG17]|uniref:Cysteine hydrolase n=1 Tax=Sphingomonas tagetis TaxID=2949092 RepID=A0A9X2KNG3_9SPHN|nr:isochorismatase family cysteine hydrolase [Sphingomonas tagetis]MCP3732506.1 cysteine hydrolase [Sphingomonas tagetis]
MIIDVINCFDFAGADVLEPKARKAAHVIAGLRSEMARKGYPTIFINDNFGEWHSERSRLVERALAKPNPVAELLRPCREDYFIIKPQFSGFYATNLPVLLPKLGVSRLILTGIATDICVLFTAADAHMRDYALWVPCDAVAAEDDARGAFSLATMSAVMGAETQASGNLSLSKWTARLDEAGIAGVPSRRISMG